MSKDRKETYADFVNYEKMDPFKVMAQEAASETYAFMEDLGFNVVKGSRGESFFAWEEPESYRVQVIEGLGTKNLVADAIGGRMGKTFYDAIAQDTIATFVNDVVASGARPFLISMYIATGESEWFSDLERARDLLDFGWKRVCEENRIVWGGGESSSLRGIIVPGTSDLVGVAQGIIRPKNREPILGKSLEAGDSIVLVESNGVHANGLTWAREVAAGHPEGYYAQLPSGITYGEALLRPTHIYSNLVRDLLDSGVDIHYMVNITGHGWRKLMRANYPFTYRMHTVPAVPEELEFIQEQKEASDESMYDTFNMGAGFAFIVPAYAAQKVREIAGMHYFQSWNAGIVEEGPKQVIIEPKNIVYSEGDLQLR